MDMDVLGGADEIDLMSAVRCRLDGREVRLTDGMRSLIILVALEGDGTVARRTVQARLWPGLESAQSAKRLRQLLWRVKRETGDRILEVTAMGVRLAPHVVVDVHEAERRARRFVSGEDEPPAAQAGWSFLREELLPGWCEDGVWEAQESWNRLRLLALERLAERALRSGDASAAIEFASVAAGVDQFNEVPHRVMAAAHLARGDVASAWRVFNRFQQLLRVEMELEPSAAFQDLVGRRGAPVARTA